MWNGLGQERHGWQSKYLDLLLRRDDDQMPTIFADRHVRDTLPLQNSLWLAALDIPRDELLVIAPCHKSAFLIQPAFETC